MGDNKWHHFGRWIEPVVSSTFWLEFQFEELEFDFFGDVRVLDGHYFLLKEDLTKVAKFVEEKITRDKQWFGKFFRFCDERAKNILVFKNKKDLSGFLKAITGLLNCSMIVELLDYGLERYIEKISQKTGVPVGKVLAQIKPHRKTILMKYHEELKNLDRADIKGVNDFIKKYKWVGTHVFMGAPLNKRKLYKELSEDSKKTEKSNKNKKLPDDYKDSVEIGSKLAFYRSHIVETADSIIYEYWLVAKELAKKHGLGWEDVLLLSHQEVIDLNDKGILPHNYKERRKGFGVVMENNKMSVVVGKELEKRLVECQEKIDTDIAEFKGMVAYKSDKKVRGVAKVIEESKNISKMKKGDILVANETTPDYVIGMKIAGAIITNQGGITSHAAITSREMKIPCIIGTKIATKVLKDGDLVEVDADRGVVKIINRA